MSWTPPNECSSCHREVIWAWTEAGKRMPIDPAEYARDDERANAAVYTDHLRRVRVRILRADRPLEGYEHRGMPHFATCPVALAERAYRANHPSARQRGPAIPRRADDELSIRRRRRTQTGTFP